MKETNLKPRSRTDWERVRNMKDEDIDFSDIPELDEEFFANARIREPSTGPSHFRTFRVDPQTGAEITTREWTSDDPETVFVPVPFDAQTLAWFESQGEAAHDKMRAALRIYALAHQEKEPVAPFYGAPQK